MQLAAILILSISVPLANDPTENAGTPRSGKSSTAHRIAINEIYYNPSARRKGGEFVEFVNAGNRVVDLSGWKLHGDVSFEFESGTRLSPDDFLVVVGDVRRAANYGYGSVAGAFEGNLPNDGGTIRLLDSAAREVDAVAYDQGGAWPADADGAGVSLELVDATSDNADPSNWAIGNSMSPGAKNIGRTSNASSVVITEILYRPRTRVVRRRFSRLRAPTYFEEGEYAGAEFVEIYNRSKKTVKLSRWRFTDGIAFEFPEGAKLHAREYAVVCRKPNVTRQLDAKIKVFGPFSGELSNGGERITLADNRMRLVDLDRRRLARDYRKCDLAIDGVAYPNIGVRYRGASSRSDAKRQWKFRFNKSKLHDGHRVLDTMVRRPLAQRIAFLVFDHSDIENLESDLVRVHLNGKFWGVYIIFESPNASWLARHGFDAAGEIYKARTVFSTLPGHNSDFYATTKLNDEAYWGIWNKKVRPLEVPTHIRELTRALNDLPDEKLGEWLDQHVDLEQWFTRWALYLLMEIDDFPAHNDYLFLPGEPGGRWKTLAYDFDSFGRAANLGLFYGDGSGHCEPNWQRNKFYERVSGHAVLRRIYLLKMREIIEEICPVETLHEIVDREYERSHPDMDLEHEKWAHRETRVTGADSRKAREA